MKQPYQAVLENEISLHVGAIITGIPLSDFKDDVGWFEGEFHGKRGLFPSKCVKKLHHHFIGGK